MVQSDQFPNLEGLVGLARDNDVDIRPTLLRVLTDFYVQKSTHSLEEERYYTELALRLIDGTDPSTLRIVARRLADYPAAPAAVVESLSRNLRPNDSSAASNEFRSSDLSTLFFDGDAAQRRLILLNLDYAPIAPAVPPREAAEVIRRLETAALARNIDEVVRILEQAFGISRIRAAHMVQDCSGEPMLVAAKALSMPADIFRRMILFLHPAVGHSVQRVHELARLYDEMSADAALRFLTIWRDKGAIRPRVAIHRALSWNDEKTRVRTTMTPAARRVRRQAETRDPNNRRRIPGRA